MADTLLELRVRFAAVSTETQTIRGLWEHEGHAYRDELVRIFVNVLDGPEASDFFIAFKERLKITFKQIDIWMTTYPLEVI